jgi:hypothetical protein
MRPYPSPPFDIRDLDFRDRTHGDLAEAGELASCLGSRYGAAQMRTIRRFTPAEDARVADVLAFSVHSMEGRLLPFTCDGDLLESLRGLWTEEIPSIPCPSDLEKILIPLEKCLLVHGGFAAPPHLGTGDPMAIEIFGRALPPLAVGARNGIPQCRDLCQRPVPGTQSSLLHVITEPERVSHGGVACSDADASRVEGERQSPLLPVFQEVNA